MKRIAVMGHSLVAERQRWFFEWMNGSAKLSLAETRIFCPRTWNNFNVETGYRTVATNDLNNYTFEPEMLIALEKYKPDLIYCQQEAYSKVTGQMMHMAKRIGCRFVLFVWDNLVNYDSMPAGVRYILKDSDLVVCGNGEAEKRVKKYNQNTLRCIQVGVNTEVFRPTTELPYYDVLFQGRMVPEKGVDVLRKAASTGRFTVLWPESFVDYHDLPVKRYAKAKVLAAPSIDTPVWKEQHAGYATLEALSCARYVVTSDSSSIHEALVSSDKAAPGTYTARRGDHDELRMGIDAAVMTYEKFGDNVTGREWVEAHYGYETTSWKLVEAFSKLW